MIECFGPSIIQRVWRELLYQDLLKKWHQEHCRQQAAIEQEMRERREERLQSAFRDSYVTWWMEAVPCET